MMLIDLRRRRGAGNTGLWQNREFSVFLMMSTSASCHAGTAAMTCLLMHRRDGDATRVSYETMSAHPVVFNPRGAVSLRWPRSTCIEVSIIIAPPPSDVTKYRKQDNGCNR